ncbi:hypothetical protein R1sor_006130 [Riccia sorocarpa]|uniref:Uncharacterized protein n=1 Tax=Riccia sorocarpa TaxID=122646 RepID=A0ABD3HT21_9MARC
MEDRSVSFNDRILRGFEAAKESLLWNNVSPRQLSRSTAPRSVSRGAEATCAGKQDNSQMRTFDDDINTVALSLQIQDPMDKEKSPVLDMTNFPALQGFGSGQLGQGSQKEVQGKADDNDFTPVRSVGRGKSMELERQRTPRSNNPYSGLLNLAEDQADTEIDSKGKTEHESQQEERRHELGTAAHEVGGIDSPRTPRVHDSKGEDNTSEDMEEGEIPSTPKEDRKEGDMGLPENLRYQAGPITCQMG